MQRCKRCPPAPPESLPALGRCNLPSVRRERSSGSRFRGTWGRNRECSNNYNNNQHRGTYSSVENSLSGAEDLCASEHLDNQILQSVCILWVFLALLTSFLRTNLGGAVQLSLRDEVRGPWVLHGLLQLTVTLSVSPVEIGRRDGWQGG